MVPMAKPASSKVSMAKRPLARAKYHTRIMVRTEPQNASTAVAPNPAK